MHLAQITPDLTIPATVYTSSNYDRPPDLFQANNNPVNESKPGNQWRIVQKRLSLDPLHGSHTDKQLLFDFYELSGSFKTANDMSKLN